MCIGEGGRDRLWAAVSLFSFPLFISNLGFAKSSVSASFRSCNKMIEELKVATTWKYHFIGLASKKVTSKELPILFLGCETCSNLRDKHLKKERFQEEF